MENLIIKFKELGYYSGKNLENKIIEILNSCNIKYKYKPNGFQKYPDFYIDDFNLELECISSIGTRPMWSFTYPKKDTMYIFSSKKLSSTLVLFGKDIITEDITKIYEEYSNKHKILHNEINSKLEKITNKYSFRVFPRNIIYTQNIGFRVDTAFSNSLFSKKSPKN